MTKHPKIIGLRLSDNRNFRGKFIEFSHVYLHYKANEINDYDCCVANIEALWYALRVKGFITDVTLTNGNMYKGIVLLRNRSEGIEGLVMLIDDLEGIKHAFGYLDIKYRISMFYDHEKYIQENYPETWNLLLTLN